MRRHNPSRLAREFYAEARELFGLGTSDAKELRSLLAAAYGFDYREQSLSEYAGEAAEVLDLVPGIQAEIEALDEREYVAETHRAYEEGLRARAEEERETGYVSGEPDEEEITESPYELDPEWEDDEWLEADDWYEVTGEYEED